MESHEDDLDDNDDDHDDEHDDSTTKTNLLETGEKEEEEDGGKSEECENWRRPQKQECKTKKDCCRFKSWKK